MSLLVEREADAFLSPEYELYPRAELQQTRFAVLAQNADRHVVVPDIHGEHKILEKVIDAYVDETDINFVFLGDVLDRKGIKNDSERGVYKSLELIKGLGNRAIMTMANHEWLFHASSYADDPVFQQALTNEWLGINQNHSIEQNVLTSYGLNPERRDQTTSKWLRRRMARAGHLGILTSATPYYETSSFIATHAGLMPGVSWELQKNYLTEVAREMDEGLYYDRPPQWFSMILATSTEPIVHTNKVVVSGHAHVLGQKSKRYPDQSKHRVLNDGKRVRLASTLNAPTNAPAFVWQDWNGVVMEVPADGGLPRRLES